MAAMLWLSPVIEFQLARYLIDDVLVFRYQPAFRYDTAERFGNASTGVVFFSNRIGEAIDAQFAACPRCHKTNRFTANAFAVAILSNPNAQFSTRALNVMEPRQSKESPAISLTDCKYKIRSFGYRR